MIRPSPARWPRRVDPGAALLALPLVLVFLYFSWGPIVRGLVMSFQQTNFVSGSTWVGWENFTYVLGDPLLPTAIGNTLWYGLLCLVFGFPLPVFLAVVISELRRRKGLYSALAYLPVVFPPVVAILLWKVFYDPSADGLFNTVLGWAGIDPLPWLNTGTTAMPALVLEATWANAGTNVIIYLAALTGVRTELYEAAELDGAGIWRRIWHVTLPQIRGITVVLILLQIIGTAQVFTEPFLFTGGGPDNATMTILLMVYNYAFINGDYGAATALSLMLAVVLCVFAGIYQLATRKLGRDS
ncbi:multiple sugar transport system permease protein [Thermocatellispora tengchongensis]|uniref:Multiple sugar transport system permease protein n=1 Tax=Thermocatellispora tengchongensis TaxID=1073253 RepID=A0A840P5R9_9ACTN|nr:sugar ABC transporter permease [Thermocatellispora tengchongensis]MBB5133253.1 multiple sugar transport system permease protein [Thermocatellispora tengchongensis]